MPSQTAPLALELRGIEVRHGTRSALSVPGLAVGAGELLAVIGPNGAGKSTLLHVAARLRWPDEGAVWIGGERATRRTAVVFLAPLLFDVSVLRNAAGLRFRGVNRRAAEDRAERWLARFGLDHPASRHAREPSDGEAQRVSLARAFAVEPDRLLLDEPFAALGAPARAALVPELAATLRGTGTSGLIVTHTVSEAVAIGDRFAVLLDGRIAQLGRPTAVVERPASAAVAALVDAGR